MLVRNVGLLDALLNDMRDDIEAMAGVEHQHRYVPRRVTGLDIVSDDDSVIVRVDLPGIDLKTLDVSLEGQRLTVRANRRALDVELGDTVVHAERAIGEVERVLELPCAVEPSCSEATYERGVLQITLPRAASARPKRIKIDVG